MSDYYHKNKERMKEQTQRHYYKYREKYIAKNKLYEARKKYGLTEKDLTQLFEAQNGSCAICCVSFATDPSLKRKYYIDHDHETGEVRGLLCHSCNLVLGFSRDNVGTLLSAIKYLKQNKKKLTKQQFDGN